MLVSFYTHQYTEKKTNIGDGGGEGRVTSYENPLMGKDVLPSLFSVHLMQLLIYILISPSSRVVKDSLPFALFHDGESLPNCFDKKVN